MGIRSLDALISGCNATTRALNAGLFQAHDQGAGRPVVEHGPHPRALATPQAQAKDTRKRFVRVVSYRVVLLDEDNLCEKFLVDALRYAGAIPGDSPDRCRIVTTQEKVAHFDEERTEVTVDLLES